MSKKWIFFSLFSSLFLAISIAKGVATKNLLFLPSPPFSQSELTRIKEYLFNNITTTEKIFIKEDNGQLIHSMPGAVLASPSKFGDSFNQDYQFHWVRDAAIVMQEVILQYISAPADEKKSLREYLINYIHFERKAQKQKSKPGQHTLGQPKYNIDATIWEGDWGRPQNDSPALRAISLTQIAHLFIKEGEEKYVRENILEPITIDLDYVAREWTQFHHTKYLAYSRYLNRRL